MRTSTTAAGRATAISLNGYLLRSSLVAALGGLLFGFDTAVISGATKALSETFALSPVTLGHYRLQRTVGDRSRFVRRGGRPATVTDGAAACGVGGLVPGFLRRLRLRLELGRVDCVSRYRGIGHWRIIRDWANVHRRNLPGRQAWTSGRALSDERGCRDSAGLSLELPRGIRRIRRIRVALEIRDGRDPGGRISGCPIRNPGKPSMVDRGGSDGGGPRSIAARWRTEPGARPARNRRDTEDAERRPKGAAIPVSIPQAHLPCNLHWHVQPAFGNQRDFVLSQRHFRACRIQQGFKRYAGGCHRLHQPRVHALRDEHDRSDWGARNCCWLGQSERRSAWLGSR